MFSLAIFRRRLGYHDVSRNVNQYCSNRRESRRSLLIFDRKEITHLGATITDLFSRRFREGISFPKFLERSILKLSLSKLCAVSLALQNRAFLREKRAKRVPRKGEEER